MTGYDAKTFVQIRQSVMRKLRSTDTATGTSDLVTGVNRAINDSIHDLTSPAFFKWTAREFSFNTVPVSTSATPLSDGMYVAAGGQSVTASDGPFTLSMVGRNIYVAGGSVPYEISNFSASNSLAIVVGFEGATNQANVAWRMTQDSFTVDARIRKVRGPVMVVSGGAPWPLVYVPPRSWDPGHYGLAEGQPQVYTIYRYTADGTPRMRLWPVPILRYVIRFSAYCYLPELSADGDILEIPGPAHRVVEDIAYARAAVDILHDTGPHVQAAAARGKAGIAMLISENTADPDEDIRHGSIDYLWSGRPSLAGGIGWPLLVSGPS